MQTVGAPIAAVAEQTSIAAVQASIVAVAEQELLEAEQASVAVVEAGQACIAAVAVQASIAVQAEQASSHATGTIAETQHSWIQKKSARMNYIT